MSLFHLQTSFLSSSGFVLCLTCKSSEQLTTRRPESVVLWVCRYQYVLGERTWIEYWPTEAECQTDEYRITCLGIEEMVDQYTLFGCLYK